MGDVKIKNSLILQLCRVYKQFQARHLAMFFVSRIVYFQTLFQRPSVTKCCKTIETARSVKSHVLFLISFMEHITLQTTGCVMKIINIHVLYYPQKVKNFFQKHLIQNIIFKVTFNCSRSECKCFLQRSGPIGNNVYSILLKLNRIQYLLKIEGSICCGTTH